MSTKTSKEKCCENCIEMAGEDTGKCAYSNCPCHKEAKQVGEELIINRCKKCQWTSTLSSIKNCPVCDTPFSQQVEEKIPSERNQCRACDMEGDCGRHDTPKVATKEERKDFTYSVMPSKVATSEKECKHEIYEYPEQHCFFCKKCGIAHGTRELFFVDTPHESEDIELSLEYLVKDFFQSIQGSTSDWQERRLMEFIESEKSKSYQRGREEGYTEGIEKCAFDEVEIEKSLLSLAVQEIEKAEKPTSKEMKDEIFYQTAGFNEGLDKAKEIISGLKK